MIKRKKIKRSLLLLTGSLLILIGILLFLNYFVFNNLEGIQEVKAVEEYYNNMDKEEIVTSSDDKKIEDSSYTKYDYIAILKIPKISLEKGLVSPNSKFNNINYNIEFLDDSSLPDEKNGNVILAAHSGNSRISYFKNLHKLSINDAISIDYNGKNYKYKVTNIYEVEKTGKIEIKRNNKTTLTLITCKDNSNKQIVIICELNEESVL